MDTFDTAASRAKDLDMGKTYAADNAYYGDAAERDTAPGTEFGTEYSVREDADDNYGDDVAEATPEALALETKAVATNWWKVAAISAGAVAVAAVAAGGYVYWRAQQQKPQTRFDRFKSRLGLDRLPLDKLGLDHIDFDKLEERRRKAAEYARKATDYARKAAHNGAKKVVELTA